jgi:hypothetical protein
LTGRPSGAVIDEGTPKYERNHMLAPSSSNRGADMPSSCQGAAGARERDVYIQVPQYYIE